MQEYIDHAKLIAGSATATQAELVPLNPNSNLNDKDGFGAPSSGRLKDGASFGSVGVSASPAAQTTPAVQVWRLLAQPMADQGYTAMRVWCGPSFNADPAASIPLSFIDVRSLQ